MRNAANGGEREKREERERERLVRWLIIERRSKSDKIEINKYPKKGCLKHETSLFEEQFVCADERERERENVTKDEAICYAD
jgi:hypothetical protein